MTATKIKLVLKPGFETKISPKSEDRVSVKPVTETKTQLKCTKCEIERPLTDYYARYKVCKECIKAQQRERNKANKAKQADRYTDTTTTKMCNECKEEKLISAFRVNRAKCNDCEKRYGIEYNQLHTDIREKWLENNKDRMKELQANWYQNNKSHVREKYKARYHSDAEFKVNSLLRKRLLHAVKRSVNSDRIIDHLGTDANTICNWFEYNFDDNMTWDNHGKYWHIDHVIPSSLHDSKDPLHVKYIHNWMNLMPITATQNMNKKNKIDLDQIAVHVQNLRDFISVTEMKENPDEYIKFTETISETP
jgi:hypothetical protein